MSDFDEDDIPRTGAISLADIEQLRALAAERNRAAAVRVMSGTRLGRVFPVGPNPITIGRSPDCTIHLDEQGVSRVHARIERQDSGSVIALIDPGSTNGTFVNGERVNKRPLQDGDSIQVGAQTLLRFSLQDELEQKFQQHQFESATRDGLTGLFSKRYLMEHLESEIAFCKRHKRLISLAMMDADHFKNINDTWGHLAGDNVLKTLAQIFTACIRKDDLLARYGGEEFVLVMRDTPPDRARVVVERIRGAVEANAFYCGRERMPVTVSIGVACGPAEKLTEDDALLKQADENLYEAKRTGRNRCVLPEDTGELPPE